MKPSGGVTAAAIVMIVIGAIIAFVTFFMVVVFFTVRATMGPGGPGFNATVIPPAIFLLVSVWGLVTGIGVLRVRRWAWFSALIISSLVLIAAFFPLHNLTKLIRATTGIPTIGAGNFIAVEYVMEIVATFIPLALGVWWLLLFVRRSVRAQFASESAAPLAAAAIDFPSSAPAVPVAFIPPPAGRPSRRPVSITVIAIFLLIGPVCFPLIFLLPSEMRITSLFGFILTGGAYLMMMGIITLADIVLGIGLWRLKPWARTGTIIYVAATLLNSLVSLRTMRRASEMILQAQMASMPALSGPDASSMERLMHSSMNIGLVFGLVTTTGLSIAALYFVLTRRAAFYAKKDGSPSAPPPFETNASDSSAASSAGNGGQP